MARLRAAVAAVSAVQVNVRLEMFMTIPFRLLSPARGRGWVRGLRTSLPPHLASPPSGGEETEDVSTSRNLPGDAQAEIERVVARCRADLAVVAQVEPRRFGDVGAGGEADHRGVALGRRAID